MEKVIATLLATLFLVAFALFFASISYWWTGVPRLKKGCGRLPKELLDDRDAPSSATKQCTLCGKTGEDSCEELDE